MADLNASNLWVTILLKRYKKLLNLIFLTLLFLIVLLRLRWL